MAFETLFLCLSNQVLFLIFCLILILLLPHYLEVSIASFLWVAPLKLRCDLRKLV